MASATLRRGSVAEVDEEVRAGALAGPADLAAFHHLRPALRLFVRPHREALQRALQQKPGLRAIEVAAVLARAAFASEPRDVRDRRRVPARHELDLDPARGGIERDRAGDDDVSAAAGSIPAAAAGSRAGAGAGVVIFHQRARRPPDVLALRAHDRMLRVVRVLQPALHPLRRPASALAAEHVEVASFRLRAPNAALGGGSDDVSGRGRRADVRRRDDVAPVLHVPHVVRGAAHQERRVAGTAARVEVRIFVDAAETAARGARDVGRSRRGFAPRVEHRGHLVVLPRARVRHSREDQHHGDRGDERAEEAHRGASRLARRPKTPAVPGTARVGVHDDLAASSRAFFFSATRRDFWKLR
eukprot:30990-Pelagococcus_subviridis.AAC.8